MQIELSEADIQVLFVEFEEVDVIINYENCHIMRLNDGAFKIEHDHHEEKDSRHATVAELAEFLNNNNARYHDDILLYLNGLNE
jgi:hypothetical protein